MLFPTVSPVINVRFPSTSPPDRWQMRLLCFQVTFPWLLIGILKRWESFHVSYSVINLFNFYWVVCFFNLFIKVFPPCIIWIYPLLVIAAGNIVYCVAYLFYYFIICYESSSFNVVKSIVHSLCFCIVFELIEIFYIFF